MIKALMGGLALLGMGCAMDVGSADAEDIDSTGQAVTALPVPVANGQATTGQATTGQATTGQATTGQATTGQATTEQAASGQEALLAATRAMQETQMSFNLQYLQLQAQMQAKNRTYTAVSNIMKTKHDTVKNSISNVR